VPLAHLVLNRFGSALLHRWKEKYDHAVLLSVSTFSNFLSGSIPVRTEEMSKPDLICNGYLLTLNQRVQGSSPCAPTNKINNLFENWRRSASQNLALDNAWATSFFHPLLL
jgi:hypothetical protein